MVLLKKEYRSKTLQRRKSRVERDGDKEKKMNPPGVIVVSFFLFLFVSHFSHDNVMCSSVSCASDTPLHTRLANSWTIELATTPLCSDERVRKGGVIRRGGTHQLHCILGQSLGPVKAYIQTSVAVLHVCPVPLRKQSTIKVGKRKEKENV
eukprot:gene790-432_t